MASQQPLFNRSEFVPADPADGELTVGADIETLAATGTVAYVPPRKVGFANDGTGGRILREVLQIAATG